MRFASFLSGGFISALVVNPPERKLAKRTSVQWFTCIRGFLCVFVFHMYVDSNNFCHLYYPQAILQIKCLRQRKNFTFQLKYFFVKKTFVHNLLPYNKAMLLCILAKVSMASEGAKKLFVKLNLFRYLTNRWRQRWICRASFLPSPLLSSVSKWLFKWQK